MSRISDGSHRVVREGILASAKTLGFWQPFIEQATDYFDLVKRLIKARKFLAFLIHEETCTVIFSCLMAASAVSMALSYRPSVNLSPSANQDSVQSDSTFYANISQGILSILTVYLTILPTLRSKTLGLRYRVWFWGSLFTSAFSSILSLGYYTGFPLVSGVFGWISAFTQVMLTLLLTMSIQRASKEGSIDGIELHVNWSFGLRIT
jgi:hypothetical protein